MDRESVLDGGEDYLEPGSTFWDIGFYRSTVKRSDDGARLADDFMKMVEDRSELAVKCAKLFQNFNKKWSTLISKGPEYGTTEVAIMSVLKEADAWNAIFNQQRDRLMKECYEEMKKWKAENYHKAIIGGWKETKEINDAFSKAQKPWAVKKAKVLRARKRYFNACRAHENAVKNERQGRDKQIDDSKVMKLETISEKSKSEKEKLKDKYEFRIEQLKDFNPTYEREMAAVFDKCQDMEENRLKAFKSMLRSYHQCVILTEDSRLPAAYNSMIDEINKANHERDLEFWSKTNGVLMDRNYPEFEEYSPEAYETLQRKPSVIRYKPGNSIHSHISYSHPEPTPVQSTPEPESEPPPAYNDIHRNDPNPFGAGSSPSSVDDGVDEWDEDEPPSEDVGVPMRALYDYTAVETDELTFKAGEIITKLTDEDSQGWCKGRYQGRDGLYPAQYCEPLY